MKTGERLFLIPALLTAALVCVRPAFANDDEDIPPPAAPHCLQPDLRFSPCDTFRFLPLAHVNFDTDKADLTAADKETLDHAATFILADATLTRVLLRGHTDYVGSVPYNDTLSDKRIATVRAYLLEKGVPFARLDAIGYGEHRPADENWTREGRARNRRVDIYTVHTAVPPD